MASQLSRLLLCLIWKHFNAMFSQFIFFSLCYMCIHVCQCVLKWLAPTKARDWLHIFFFIDLNLIYLFRDRVFFLCLDLDVSPPSAGLATQKPQGSDCFCLLPSSGFMGVCLHV